MVELGTLKPLADLRDGELYLHSRDIAGALWAAGIDETDCGFTGLLEITDTSGWEVQEIWATNYARPFDVTSSYTLIHARARTAATDDWPGFGSVRSKVGRRGTSKALSA